MVEAAVTQRSPLHGHDAALAAAGALEVPFLAMLELRADPEAAQPRVGIDLPLVPNTWARSDGVEALWTSPDGWLLVGAPGSAGALAARLGGDLEGLAHALVDVSALRAVIDLGGEDRFELLAQGCGLDLHPRSWRVGQCAQTLLARVPVLLQEREQATRVLVRQSLAEHLAAWLRTIRPPS